MNKHHSTPILDQVWRLIVEGIPTLIRSTPFKAVALSAALIVLYPKYEEYLPTYEAKTVQPGASFGFEDSEHASVASLGVYRDRYQTADSRERRIIRETVRQQYRNGSYVLPADLQKFVDEMNSESASDFRAY